MTEAPHENRSKSRGISRYALALIPLVASCGIAAAAAKKLYDQDFHGKNIGKSPPQ